MFRGKFILGLLFLVLTSLLSAQDLTKVAVVDMGRIVDSYFRDSAGIREVKQLQTEYEEYVRKIGYSLVALKEKMLKARLDDDKTKEKEFLLQISDKERALTEYHNVKTEEIRLIKMETRVNNEFERRLQRVIQTVAIELGFSLVLEDSMNIFWYDREDVDITDQVLEKLAK